MQSVAGIDVGTGLTKAVILKDLGNGAAPSITAKAMARTGARLEEAARHALEAACGHAGLAVSDIAYTASTGFGRYAVPFRDIQITEITSGARGAAFFYPEAQFVLDIGSQSTRAVRLNENGRVDKFKTNDKCAAGSGSFIVRAAKYLQIELEHVGEIALSSENPQPISSVCAVLAESEIINHVSSGVEIQDILRGIYDSLAERSASLLKRTGFNGELTFIGGVARQRGMVRALEDRLQTRVLVPDDCEYVAAVGAALLGLKRMQVNATPIEECVEERV